MKSTRLRLGKLWKESLEANKEVPKQVNINHPYIKEYENSIETKEEVKPKPKGKRK